MARERESANLNMLFPGLAMGGALTGGADSAAAAHTPGSPDCASVPQDGSGWHDVLQDLAGQIEGDFGVPGGKQAGGDATQADPERLSARERLQAMKQASTERVRKARSSGAGLMSRCAEAQRRRCPPFLPPRPPPRAP